MIESLLHQALSIHVCCKEGLREAIETGIPHPPSGMIRSNVMCEFGQWLNSSDLSIEISSSQHHANIQKIHADFHIAAAEIMELVEIGETQQAKQMMLLGGKYTLQANKLKTEILNWVAELGN
jgi:cephalosporin hydroxylase